MMEKLKTKKKFKDAQRRLTASERAELEKHIFADGKILDPIIVDQNGFIVDGHNRYEIAVEHDLPFETRVKEFASDDDAVTWILWHQAAKRNLSAADTALVLGRIYNRNRETDGGGDKMGHSVASAPQSPRKKRAKRKVPVKEIAKKAGKSRKAVERAGKYAKAYDKLPVSITKQIEENPALATQKAVIRMAGRPEGEWGGLARKVRTGDVKTFDEAVFGKDSPPEEKPGDMDVKKARSAIGVLVRYFDAATPPDAHAKYLLDQLLGRMG